MAVPRRISLGAHEALAGGLTVTTVLSVDSPRSLTDDVTVPSAKKLPVSPSPCPKCGKVPDDPSHPCPNCGQGPKTLSPGVDGGGAVREDPSHPCPNCQLDPIEVNPDDPPSSAEVDDTGGAEEEETPPRALH
jgi:hypothetical protein